MREIEDAIAVQRASDGARLGRRRTVAPLPAVTGKASIPGSYDKNGREEGLKAVPRAFCCCMPVFCCAQSQAAV